MSKRNKEASTKRIRSETENCQAPEAARTIAPEDLEVGEFVAISSRVVEMASHHWANCDSFPVPIDQPVRVHILERKSGTPLKVRAICLPYVFVESPQGRNRILDVRQHRLVRLSSDFAKLVWKAMR